MDQAANGDWVAVKETGRQSAEAGIQFLILFKYLKSWMPAFAGMTN